MASQQFRLPDLGEGLTEGEILRWLVNVGDSVRLNQPIVEVETVKAAVEVPSPLAGVVTEILVSAGAIVPVGAPLVRIDVEISDAAEGRGGGSDAVPGSLPAPVLVGYGPPPVAAPRRRSTRTGRAKQSEAVARGPQPLAPPPVRKLARDLGVHLETLRGSGPGGVISREDVARAAGAARSPAAAPEVRSPEAVGAARSPAAERLPLRGVRRAMSMAVTTSAFTAPHASVCLAVDVTASMRLRERLAGLSDFAGLPVSPLLLVAKALLVAARRHPLINSSWDEAAQEIVIHPAVNLGIAVATARGLVVPNVKDAGALPLAGLARALGDLTDAAREGRTTPAAMTGGTITITNVGVFGVDGGTPILNPGEAAILALGRVRQMPWVVDGGLAVRDVVQLTLAFDHRIVDGRLAGEFLADVSAMLTEPAMLTAWS
ncbi:MAG: dihydrolipoamide acetyltransferase family protein [Frankiaceae bacterium]